MSEEDKVQNIISCVDSLVKFSEESTLKDRERWQLAHSLFAGKLEESESSENEESRTQVSLHTFSKICRNSAAAIQEILHQDPIFYEFVSPDGEELDEFGKALKKLHQYRVDQLKIPNHTYKFVLAGAIAGIGVNKLKVTPYLEETEEYVLSLLRNEQQKESKGISEEVEKTNVVAAEGLMPEEIDLQPTDNFTLSEMFSSSEFEAGKKATKRLKYKLSLGMVNPANYFWDPTVDNIKDSAWCAERYWVPMYKLDPLFKSGFLTNKKDLIDVLGDGARAYTSSTLGDSFEYQSLLYQDQYYRPNEYCPLVEVIEYYGPIIKKGTGEIEEENRRVIIANGKVVLKNTTNPDWKRRPPYFVSVMSEVPFKAVGAGVADTGIDNEMISNRLMSLALDHLAFIVYGVTGVKIGDLEEPDQVEGGMYPGMMLKIRDTAQNAKDVLHQIDHNPNSAFPLIQMLEKLELSANASAGVDTTSANPTSRARISASEVNSNIARSSRSQYSLGRELDDSYLEEVLVRVLDFVLQYDLENKALEEASDAGIISYAEYELIKNIPKTERLKESKRKYRLSVRGFRERLEKNEYLSRLSEFMQQMNFLMQASPQVTQMIDFKRLVQSFAEAYNMPADKLIISNSPSDQAMEENYVLREDRRVEVLQDDEHAVHLPQHYDELFKVQNQALVEHIQQHLMIAQQAGIGIAPPPPELQGFIFGDPEQEEDQGQLMQ